MLPMEFIATEPTLENHWRSIILFGKNTASYKFALAKSLIELGELPNNDLITLDELSEPFSRHLCEHLKQADKQGSRPIGVFLEACRQFNSGEITQNKLLEITRQYGFKNVIDAFHNVNSSEIPKRFFVDERKSARGIRLTDDIYELFTNSSKEMLSQETEARWRLVETSWELGINRNMIAVNATPEDDILFTTISNRRTNITSCRDALNGYQKGRCFYCFQNISVVSGDDRLADVDHFLPNALKLVSPSVNWDGIWNLVLACQDCNRGPSGKFTRVPELSFLDRLYRRNEYLITSHHPLRETLMQQTGNNPKQRQNMLQSMYTEALSYLIHKWAPKASGDSRF